MARTGRTLAIFASALLASCFEDTSTPIVTDVDREVFMDFASSDLYGAPFPGEHLVGDDGAIDLSRATNPVGSTIVDQIHDALATVDGFGTTSPIHFRLDGPIDTSLLPDARASVTSSSPILLLDVDPESPFHGALHPFRASFDVDAGPYAGPNLLTLLPVQGRPLRPRTRYAAILTRALRGDDDQPFVRAPALDALLAGETPDGLSERAASAFRDALDRLRELETVALDDVVALTVFRTGDPLEVLRRAVAATEGAHAPALETAFEARETFDDYCVFEGAMRVPVFQQGEPPFQREGGAWALDDDGAPVRQREETARVWITIPRTTMPAAGFPTTMLIRTGAGGDRPLVDRGARAEEGGPALAPGTGPALEFARAGFAGISIEGPHGGSRNVSGGDEQFLVFNIQNPIALRDNLRQSALELVLLARALDTLTIDASSCEGFASEDGSARFDTAHLALFGHSMGASIAPLAAAFEPRFAALVLSGAGASWIENVVYKERPIATRPLAEALLRYTGRRQLTEHDVMLGLLQWAGEAADAQVYAPLLVHAPEVGAPRHVLMFQGIVDRYILPPIANPLSLALGVDRAGPALDADDPRLDAYDTLEHLLWLSTRGLVDLPAAGNVEIDDAIVTAVVAQHAEDGIEDGHETAFQTEAPKAQYRCFLRTFARDEAPRVPDPGVSDPSCE
ncbi:alpha/beta hydrolase [Sandaracinus amylolyticus]|uniref:Bacterial virulence factor lipase N-terminal domain-containing protein n=1 Tax=Sandaracinus amylolyticus TaxID=927083 RepID=A0A0F6YKX6_9BACT|nr:alpha/beta hydrolase [Sandaracinus amylolyticus]AKF07738.1 hypothetical protein DB32_004887 [Sandaracinus amylolyticus]